MLCSPRRSSGAYLCSRARARACVYARVRAAIWRRVTTLPTHSFIFFIFGNFSASLQNLTRHPPPHTVPGPTSTDTTLLPLAYLLPSPPLTNARRRDLFKSLDTSGDGFLSYGELLDGLNDSDLDWEKLDCDR